MVPLTSNDWPGDALPIPTFIRTLVLKGSQEAAAGTDSHRHSKAMLKETFNNALMLAFGAFINSLVTNFTIDARITI